MTFYTKLSQKCCVQALCGELELGFQGFCEVFDEKRRKNEVLWPKTGWKMLKVVVFGLNFGGVQRPKKVGFGMTLGLLRPQNLQVSKWLSSSFHFIV